MSAVAERDRATTIHDLDALVADSSWPVVAGAAVFTLGYASLNVVMSWQVYRGTLGIAVPLALLIVGLIGFGIATRLRRTVARILHLVAAALILAASGTAVLWHAPVMEIGRITWGPVVAGIVLMVFALYRPVREVAVVAVAYLAVLGVAAWWVARDTSTAFRSIYVLMCVLPTVMLAAGGIAFSVGSARLIRLWREQAEQESRSELDAMRLGIARSVTQERISVLGGDVVPLFTAIVERGAVTDADVAAARAAAGDLRSLLVEEAQRSWLEDLIGSLGTGVVDDPAQLAGEVPSGLRPGIRALVVSIAEHPAYRPATLAVRLDREAGRVVGDVRATIDRSAQRLRGQLSPYVAVLRGSAARVDVDIQSANVCVRFTCDPESH